MALTWSFDSRSMPIAAATSCTFLVLVPVAHVSPAAAPWKRPVASSGKRLPVRSLGIPGGERAHARDEAALPVAAPAAPGRLAEPVRLGRQHLVHDRLGEMSERLPHVHEPVLEARDGKRRLRRPHVCHAVHHGRCPSPEPASW